MLVQLQGASKRFGHELIFRQLDYSFKGELQSYYAVTGANGSGKSTLLQILAGLLPLTSGKIEFRNGSNLLPIEQVYHQVSITAPYLELIEELTLAELIRFHIQFKPLQPGLTPENLIDRLELARVLHRPIKFFSSGMKQRVKLGLCLFSDTQLKLLDEPTNNLDLQGIRWYQDYFRYNKVEAIFVIFSNQPVEYEFCSQILHLPDFKK
ncbi:MAG TPA: ABC transporter ATP-binding protein [Microscillaceae bacterium]|nr:ABC transporter ATP-binding protein [Microscillaceae bacterium]